VYHALLTPGGSEYACLHLLKLLCDIMRLDVTIGVFEGADLEKLEKIFRVHIENKPRVVKLRFANLPVAGIYRKLLSYFAARTEAEKFDLVLNMHGEVIPYPAHITYYHGLPLSVMKSIAVEFAKYDSGLWKAYFRLYENTYTRYEKLCIEDSIVVTNSLFSKMIIEKYLNVKCFVVNPPVDLEDYLKLRENTDREDAVVYIARFHPEKRHISVLQLAELLRHVKFYLIGSVHPRYRDYYSSLRLWVESRGLNNVVLMPNASYEEKLRVLARAKVYLHAALFEPLGLAVIEAAAAGLVPVVPVCSGAYTDVTCFGRFGLGYRRFSELAPLIEEALARWRRLQVPVEYLARFRPGVFYEKMRRVIEKFL